MPTAYYPTLPYEYTRRKKTRAMQGHGVYVTYPTLPTAYYPTLRRVPRRACVRVRVHPERPAFGRLAFGVRTFGVQIFYLGTHFPLACMSRMCHYSCVDAI